MRIFEIFTYNLNQIKFKDNQEFLDGLLEELGLAYSDIAFCFDGDSGGSVCDKAIKACPQLKEYKQYLPTSAQYLQSPPAYRFSSSYVDEAGNRHFHIREDQADPFRRLLKKIPHGVNFGFMGVVLDHVSWHENAPQKPAFCDFANGKTVYGYQFNDYLSDSIRFFKAFDYGSKYNPVELVIERTEENGELAPYPAAFSALQARLGKSVSQHLLCRFEDAEKEKLTQTARIIDETIQKNHPAADSNPEKTASLLDSVTPAAGFSPKSAFSKAARKHGYGYAACANSCSQYRKKNGHNHSFEVEIMQIPFSSLFEGSVAVKGYNFSHLLCRVGQTALKDGQQAEAYAEKLFEMAQTAEENYGELLLLAYGSTPAWFAR